MTMPMLAVVALMAVLAGCRLPGAGTADPGAAPPGSAAQAIQLRLMSFNIRFNTAKDLENAWPLRRELVYRVIREADPDIVGVQEALRDQLDDLKVALPDHGQIGVGRDDGMSGGEHAAILYRSGRFQVLDSGTFWLSESPEVPSRSWGEWPRICTWTRFRDLSSGRSFFVFNTHLDLIQLAREKGVAVLVTRIAARSDRDPLVLLGDFNAGEGSALIRYLKGELTGPGAAAAGGAPGSPRLLDTYRVVHPMETEVRTNHGWRGTTTGDKIDYIFVEQQAGAEVPEAAIVRAMEEGRYPSDHFPVTAVVRFPEASSPPRPFSP